ncbi:putative nitrilase 2 protein [Rosellinia necatrix]|uniref:Putative nitrilase 2 protein n=1 Tax=Rosellinia necatrix TaxID=77044 RepID=A0A1S8A912_ROSNE|nr:putative nitrilase 2 protein [Rosellinia necatrix]
MEMTLSAVRDYVRVCAFGPDASWTWIPEGYTSRRRGIDLRGSRREMLQAVDDFYYLQTSIDENRPPKEIFQLVNSTLNSLNVAIKSELPDLVFQMVEILRHPWSNHTELSRIFRRHVAELGIAHLGINHPLSILWRQMLREYDDNSTMLIESLLEMVLQELLTSMGPQDHLTCVALDYVLRFIIHTQDAYRSYLRFAKWLKAYPKWDDPPKWSSAVHSRLELSRLELSTAPAIKPKHHVGGVRSSTSAAIEYPIRRGDPHSRYLLTYLSGRIAIRNGDAQRAEDWFLKAKQVTWEIKTMPHIVDYYPKVYTNLHVLYTATMQEGKLKILHDELTDYKAWLPVGVKWPAHLLPPDCPDCI